MHVKFKPISKTLYDQLVTFKVNTSLGLSKTSDIKTLDWMKWQISKYNRFEAEDLTQSAQLTVGECEVCLRIVHDMVHSITTPTLYALALTSPTLRWICSHHDTEHISIPHSTAKDKYQKDKSFIVCTYVNVLCVIVIVQVCVCVCVRSKKKKYACVYAYNAELWLVNQPKAMWLTLSPTSTTNEHAGHEEAEK